MNEMFYEKKISLGDRNMKTELSFDLIRIIRERIASSIMKPQKPIEMLNINVVNKKNELFDRLQNQI